MVPNEVHVSLCLCLFVMSTYAWMCVCVCVSAMHVCIRVYGVYLHTSMCIFVYICISLSGLVTLASLSGKMSRGYRSCQVPRWSKPQPYQQGFGVGGEALDWGKCDYIKILSMTGRPSWDSAECEAEDKEQNIRRSGTAGKRRGSYRLVRASCAGTGLALGPSTDEHGEKGMNSPKWLRVISVTLSNFHWILS